MIFNLKISSKTKSLIVKFIYFFMRLKTLPYTITHINNYNIKKFVTVLKSPHVNKTAQEQFEFRHYNCQFTVYSPKPFLMLFVLKRLFGSVFLGLKFELKVFLDTINVQKKSLNPDNYIIKNLEFPILLLAENNKDKRVYSEKIILKYLQLFDLFGEVNLKSYNSKF